MRLRRLRTASLMISIAGAAVAFLLFERFLGEDKVRIEDPAIVGTWTEEKTGLDLEPDGRYVSFFLDSSGRVAAAECGRWASYEGILHLRARWSRAKGPRGVLASPTLRQGEYRLGKDSLAVALKGGSGGEETLLLSRGPAASTAFSAVLDDEARANCLLGATR